MSHRFVATFYAFSRDHQTGPVGQSISCHVGNWDDCLTTERSGPAGWVGCELINSICRGFAAWSGPEPTKRGAIIRDVVTCPVWSHDMFCMQVQVQSTTKWGYREHAASTQKNCITIVRSQSHLPADIWSAVSWLKVATAREREICAAARGSEPFVTSVSLT